MIMFWQTTQSSLYGEDGYETINNFPIADAVKSEPPEAVDKKVEFDPTQKNNKVRIILVEHKNNLLNTKIFNVHFFYCLLL